MTAARTICAAHRSTPATRRHTGSVHNAIVIMRCHGQAFAMKRYSLPPLIPRFADRQTARISIPDHIRDAYGWPRNDQDALYDKQC